MSPASLPGPGLGHVASGRRPPLYVVKVGSSSQSHPGVYDELAALRARGARLLVVAGGAAGVTAHYAATRRPVRSVTLRNGDQVRYCPPEEMAHLVAAYEQVTLPRIHRALETCGLSVFATTGHVGALVAATVNPPFLAEIGGRRQVVRDHRAGQVTTVAVARLLGLLDTVDAVVVSPPVAAVDGGPPVNIDADVLAAVLANALDADHLRLVTGTPGLLRDVADPTSRVSDAHRGDGAEHASGRMRQKVRAAEIALAGPADVAICGPHMLSPSSGTRFWRAPAPAPDLTLISRAVEMSSVSGDERELADFLVDWCTREGVEAHVDAAGNLVARKGSGPRRLLLLGHLDTVPHRWPARWDGTTLHGRGCVDAKGSLVVFLETLASLEVPDSCQVTVVGAVQEESTSAGAAYLGQQPAADAVIVGEPSGSTSLTIGYHGLVKVRLQVSDRVGHTAGRGVSTAADQLIDILHQIRDQVQALHPDALMATLGVHAVNDGDHQIGEAVVDIRVPDGLDPHYVTGIVAGIAGPHRTSVLRATPATKTGRSHPLVRSFSRAFHQENVTPRYLAKKGSCDMNTLVTAWGPVPWVAFGPGDASLDHTPDEHLDADELRRCRAVLRRAVTAWLDDNAVDASPNIPQPHHLLGHVQS